VVQPRKNTGNRTVKNENSNECSPMAVVQRRKNTGNRKVKNENNNE
jgi:hypothetical protein